MNDNEPPSADAPRPDRDYVRKLRRLARSDSPREEIDAALLKTIQAARRGGREAELVEALLTTNIGVFASVATIQAALMLAAKAGRADAFSAKLARLHKRDVAPPRWGPLERRRTFEREAKKAKVDEAMVDDLVALKYVRSPAAFDGAAAAAEHFAPRIDLPQQMVDTLYAASRDPGPDKEAFTVRLQQGFAFEHVVTDLFGRHAHGQKNLPTIAGLEEAPWADGAFDGFAGDTDGTPKPKVFLTFHGSLFGSVKNWFKTAFPDGLRIGTQSSKRVLSSAENANGALLEAYRAAMDGKPLLIAADSPIGVAKNLLHVLGRQVPVADGFVFLSFETRADVYWLIVVEEDGKLTPRIVPGPTRADRERIAAYRARLIAFVDAQLTDYLTGDPTKISLHSKWIGLLENSGDDYLEKHYRPA